MRIEPARLFPALVRAGGGCRFRFHVRIQPPVHLPKHVVQTFLRRVATCLQRQPHQPHGRALAFEGLGFGKTPLSVALEKGYADVAEEIRRHGVTQGI